MKIRQISNKQYRNLQCFAFRKCDKFLIESLINEQIWLSSVSTFNDPFDTPLLHLSNQNDDFIGLVQEASSEMFRVACFVRNVRLPYVPKKSIIPIINEKKHRKDRSEYLNELMWAHYADAHKGVCIKYSFENGLYPEIDAESDCITWFEDVVYTDELEKINAEKLSLSDAFFKKGKSWEYENELRLIQCKVDCHSERQYINIQNSIEAVFFGLMCPIEDQRSIINILRNRVYCIKKSVDISASDRKPVRFYKMVRDDKKFGRIRAHRLYAKDIEGILN